MTRREFTRDNRIGDGAAVSTPTAPSYISRMDTAKELDIGVRGVDYHVREGNLTPIKQGRQTMFLRAEVEELRTERHRRRTDDTLRRAVGERQRQDDLKFQEISERLKFLEHISGVAGRAAGLNKPILLAMTEEVVRKSRQVDRLSTEEKAMWMERISALDYKTVKFCLKTQELSNLPLWILRLGMKIAASRETKKEKNEDLLHCRNLRLLLQSFAPPRPVYYCSFPLPQSLSPVDALILASHTAH